MRIMTLAILPRPACTPRPRGGLLTRLCRGDRQIVAEPVFEELAGEGWADRIMQESVTDRFHAKQGRSIGRWTLQAADGQQCTVFLKRHYVLPRWSGYAALFFPGSAWSPGLQEWEHLAWAAKQGIPVPRPMAAGEFRDPWGRIQSFLAVEELQDMLPLNEAIPLAHAQFTEAAFSQWKRGLIREIARIARELHRRRAFHKDLYLCHYYIHIRDCHQIPDTFQGRLTIIDLHRLGQHPYQWLYYQIKDLAQLLYSTDEVPGITDQDRMRFWTDYRRGDWGQVTTPPRWLNQLVEFKWQRYRKHNVKRKAQSVAGR